MKQRKSAIHIGKRIQKRLACRFEESARWLARFLPEKLTGCGVTLKSRIQILDDPEDVARAVDQERFKVCKRYCLIILVGGVILALTWISTIGSSQTIYEIQRPEPGEGTIHIPVKVRALLDGEMVEQETELTIQERTRSKKEESLALDRLEERLPDLILGKNSDLGQVSHDLNLIQQDLETGTTLRWETERSDLIDEEGNVFLLNLHHEKEEVSLMAFSTAGSTSRKIQLNIVIVDNPLNYELGLRRQIMNALDSLNENRSSSSVQLPDQVGKGGSLQWVTYQKSRIIIIVIIMLMTAFWVNGTKYNSLNRRTNQYKESIRREFPAFIDKLVLLLNAGLTALAAMEKIASDYNKTEQISENNVLYRELHKIQRKVQESNVSMVNEWRTLGMRTEINEILRFSAILENNINKGSGLTDKLESEGRLLWHNRKKGAEEKGRMVETKMIAPMILLLASLIIVTISPAMLEM